MNDKDMLKFLNPKPFPIARMVPYELKRVQRIASAPRRGKAEKQNAGSQCDPAFHHSPVCRQAGSGITR
ncbi:hypothetical protein [Amorphus orientalis]|uniref:hypothetical protein n=1 Tax=Amorphus orientalis TaxID=649198 RepID=UPI0027D8DACC|nr:hypothetical protein [Amorphus orientalis]